jgi:DNA modification methylase/superfamily II DNA or RNA helicase
MSGDYATFLLAKRRTAQAIGPIVEPDAVHPMLFPFQRALVCWAVRKGRAALFADTGLGKTFMQLEWARILGRPTLIVAPLSVARQTSREAEKLGIHVRYSRGGPRQAAIEVTNYEMLEHFDPAEYEAVVLDESSILKAVDGKTRTRIIEMFRDTTYRLACTATPAPNDLAEIGNHAEFLGVASQTEMLAEFFIHDSGGAGDRSGWRLKGHAEREFFRWLASWSMSVRKPSDIGYDDSGYDLPPLTVAPKFVHADYIPEGQLLFGGLKGITDRSKVRKATAGDRVALTAEMVNATPGQWIVWHGLNDEGTDLMRLIPDAVLVEGSQTPEHKAAALEAFQDGETRVLITKPRIAGFGMNFQNAHQMAFVGLSDSWEAYYQCIRRCWRFGQTEPVTAHVVLSDAESAIYENVMRKEEEATRMADSLMAAVADFERLELEGDGERNDYRTDEATGAGWRMLLGDSTERIKELADASVDFSVFSPPFSSLFTYSPSDRDLGNSRDDEQFWQHFRFIISDLLRVMKPGRNIAVHVQQIPRTVARDGWTGLKDFRGDTIRAFEGEGWQYHGEVCIDKDPQAQAIRTKAKGLLFVQKERDRSWLRPAFADYILVFRKPGQNAVPIKDDHVSNEDWISWARPIWYGIRESETLNAAEGRDDRDEKHIAPLQLETIRRCVNLWSNVGELVFSPFGGIGSEGFVSIREKRRYIGIELKPSYWQAAIRNLQRAEGQLELWSAA